MNGKDLLMGLGHVDEAYIQAILKTIAVIDTTINR